MYVYTCVCLFVCLFNIPFKPLYNEEAIYYCIFSDISQSDSFIRLIGFYSKISLYEYVYVNIYVVLYLYIMVSVTGLTLHIYVRTSSYVRTCTYVFISYFDTHIVYSGCKTCCAKFILIFFICVAVCFID